MSSDSYAALTTSVKDLARLHGAALVGVASIDRFEPHPPFYDAPPEGHQPKEFLPEAQAVISFCMPVLDQVVDAPARLAERDLPMIPRHVRYQYFERLYGHTGHTLQDFWLEFIAQMVAQWLLVKGYQCMIFPTTGLHPAVEGMTDKEIWEGPSRPGAEQTTPFRYTFGPFSHRHAATRAGLGEFGCNNVVLTREFGPRQRFNSIITDAPLVADPLITQPICLRDKCRLCHKACIANCITLRDDPNVKDYRSVENDDRTRIFIDTPSKTDPTLCRRRRDGMWDSPVRGDCIRVCPIPFPRKHLPERLKAIREAHRKGG